MSVTVPMRVMSAGDGYKYLLKTVAAADGNGPQSDHRQAARSCLPDLQEPGRANRGADRRT